MPATPFMVLAPLPLPEHCDSWGWRRRPPACSGGTAVHRDEISRSGPADAARDPFRKGLHGTAAPSALAVLGTALALPPPLRRATASDAPQSSDRAELRARPRDRAARRVPPQ